jgi:Zn-finger nucleic acid-binding protein
MNKLSIAIDMGAKNNGVFIVKSDGDKIVDKRAENIIVDNINFSKKSRRENRHKDRNYKRRKLAKRLLKELIDFNSFNEREQKSILGLLNSRGYTFLSTSSEFESLDDKTVEFNNKYLIDISKYQTKDQFEDFFTNDFEDEKNLLEFLNRQLNSINIEYKKKKVEFCKDFQKEHSIIKKDLKILKDFLSKILEEINTGSKPRKKYLKDIKDEIESLAFIEDKNSFFNLVGNISNLQLRVLRKFYNNKSAHKDRYQILKTYFLAHHYKSEKEKLQRKKLFKEINKFDDLKKFLENCEPNLTIPPYEDMNNRDTYKCNSMLIKPELITDELKETIDFLLSKPEFEILKRDENGELKVEELKKTKVITDNKKVEQDFTYSKYFQRILDVTPDITSLELNPRNVFKHKAKFARGTIDSVVCFKKEFGDKTYNILKSLAEDYYKEEEKNLSGIYEESTSMLTKCNTNTPYKNNAKHILLKPIYSYNFTSEESDKFLEDIKNTYGLQKALQRVSDEAKKYQNSFYHIVEACYSDKKCVDDKEIKSIVNNLDKNFQTLKGILKDKDTYLNILDRVNSENLKRVINIFKQTYEILFKELGGFNKTCKECTKENAIRSDERRTIGKRLLSDVAKPIDGMLDMMLDRLSYEITKNIDRDYLKGVNNLEILLEQNRFEFEENLNTIKRANNSSIKKYKRDYKDKLNVSVCPYSGKPFEKGDYDHILPQSKGVYNSKANMIYASVEGNQKIKGNRDYTLEMLEIKHLEAVFGKNKKIEDIKAIIKKGIDSIDLEQFTNFDNLKLHQQIALRYALFMRGTKEFNKAFEIVKKDKIKTFSNGTQKRLVRFIYEKLAKKYPLEFKDIEVNSKTIDSGLVSNTRKYLAVDQNTGEINHLFKQQIQNSHSHCIDAMVVFYLANSKVKGRKDRQKENVGSIESIFDFEKDIYLSKSGINNLSKNKTFINSPKKEIGSYQLFDDTIYSENYKHIKKTTLKESEINLLIKYSLLFTYEKGKKRFILSLDDMVEQIVYKLDVQRVSNTIYKLFIKKNRLELSRLKFLDRLRYSTSRKEIQSIFFDDKQTRLLEFENIKSIPPYSTNLYKSVYKKLQNEKNLFKISDDGKTILDQQLLEKLLKDMFESKQKEKNKEIRKRGKKRHKYTLPILGSPKFRIKRGNTWQVLGNKDIATKNYIIDGNIKPIPYFTKNTIPLKVSDLLDCLLINNNSKSIYEVDINIDEVNSYIESLKYFVSEAKRCTVQVSLIKESFSDINFSSIGVFDGQKDEEFKKLLENYIDNKGLTLNKYIGSIRDGLKAKATLFNNNSKTITLQYKAAINSDKKQIILKNLKDSQ